MAIINDADFILLIHDGRSKGTLNELELTKKLKKPYKKYILKPEVFFEELGGFNL